mmetsp:Transcript_7406/g.11878  ORF Transcript_7406/g.11878 Transcript_7406/m.11878 type:complete len:135 (+) Transcript_7406:2820-3224(+)
MSFIRRESLASLAIIPILGSCSATYGSSKVQTQSTSSGPGPLDYSGILPRFANFWQEIQDKSAPITPLLAPDSGHAHTHTTTRSTVTTDTNSQVAPPPIEIKPPPSGGQDASLSRQTALSEEDQRAHSEHRGQL